MKPSVGRIVHYVAPGSADGTFPSEHRAAIITAVQSDKGREIGLPETRIGLAVFNPQGIHFVNAIDYDEDHGPFTWHWPERVDE